MRWDDEKVGIEWPMKIVSISKNDENFKRKS